MKSTQSFNILLQGALNTLGNIKPIKGHYIFILSITEEKLPYINMAERARFMDFVILLSGSHKR